MLGINNFVILLLFGLIFFIVEAKKASDIIENDPENPEVTSPLGKIRGSLMKTRLGKTIYSFRGIRYGEPPVGPLRFKVSDYL